jgi:hypothetical protein
MKWQGIRNVTAWLIAVLMALQPVLTRSNTRAQESGGKPVRVIDYVYRQPGWEYETAILDDLIVRLQSSATIVIRAHPGNADLPGVAMRRALTWRNYLTSGGRVGLGRIRILSGPAEAKLRLEAWVVPVGVGSEVPGLDFGDRYAAHQPTKYDEYSWAIAGREDEDVLGEQGSENELACLTGFAAALRANPGHRGYIVLHPQLGEVGVHRRDTKRLAESVLRHHIRILQNDLGVAADRINGELGQYRKWRTFELWLVPIGAKLPALN